MVLERYAYREQAGGSFLVVAFPPSRVSLLPACVCRVAHSLLARPYGIWAFFKAFVTIPFQNKDSSAGGIVLEIMRNLLLRREKRMKDKSGNPIVPLPEKKFITVCLSRTTVVERRI